MVCLRLDGTRRDGQNDRKRRDDQRHRYGRCQSNTSSACGELAPDDPVLAFEIAVKSYDEDEDGHADESRAERFSYAA